MECEVYWQGGEAMIMGPEWFVAAGHLMDCAAAERGRHFIHYLQTNLISYIEAWNEVIANDVSRLVGNIHGLSEPSPEVVQRRLGGIYAPCGHGSLEMLKLPGSRWASSPSCTREAWRRAPEKFYRYFTEELGLTDFQVNTPFPGGPAGEVEGAFQLETSKLASLPFEVVRYLDGARFRCRSVAWAV